MNAPGDRVGCLSTEKIRPFDSRPTQIVVEETPQLPVQSTPNPKANKEKGTPKTNKGKEQTAAEDAELKDLPEVSDDEDVGAFFVDLVQTGPKPHSEIKRGEILKQWSLLAMQADVEDVLFKSRRSRKEGPYHIQTESLDLG